MSKAYFEQISKFASFHFPIGYVWKLFYFLFCFNNDKLGQIHEFYLNGRIDDRKIQLWHSEIPYILGFDIFVKWRKFLWINALYY